MKGYTEKNLEAARQDMLDALLREDDYATFCKVMEDATEEELVERSEYLQDLEMRGWSR